MFTRSMKYEALAQDDSGQGSSESISLRGEGTFETEKRVKQSSLYDRILDAVVRYSPLVIGTATVFNIFLLIFFSNRPLSTKEYNVHELEQRSVYIGFDKLYSKPSTATYEPITNYPLLVSSVSSSEPQKVFPLWDYRKLSSLGYLPLAENPLRLTPEVSAVAQFQVRDYGMEKCALVLDVPASNSTDTRVTIRGSDGKDSVVLDVYSLDTTQKLDFRQLSNPPCVFTTTMFHQLRCLDILRSAMNNHYHAEAVPPMPELAQHCLNYIRQTITCTGDVHISDTLCYHGHPEVREDPLICRDWTRAYEALEGNQREYFKSNGGPIGS